MKRPWRRRNYFIKKELQGKYIFSFFIFVIFGSVIFSLIFSMLSANTLTIVYENYNLQIGKTPLILLKEILSAHWLFIVTAGLIVIITSMFLTHRFAGPMYRFEKSLEEMRNGNFSFQVRLRKKDEGKELAQMMNQMMDMLSSRINEMRQLVETIDSSLTHAGESLSPVDQGTTANTIQEGRKAIKSLRDILNTFKIKNDA